VVEAESGWHRKRTAMKVWCRKVVDAVL